ncbi:MAG: substrate-binding domain-containing protein [Bacteroidota bacterium]
MKIKDLTIIALVLSAAACTPTPQSGKTDTPTSGELVIGVDESYIPMMDTQIYTFESIYKKAFIHPLYKPEAEIIQDLINDSIRSAVIGRDLTEKEKEYFKSKTHPAFVTKIAVDAVALIVNRENTDSLLTLGQVRNIFSGTDSTWKQVNGKNSAGTINVVFDNNGSANYRYMKEEVLKGAPLSKNAYAKHSNAEVIDYVNTNKNAIGVISVAWLADRKDSLTQSFMEKVRVVAISEFESPDDISDYKKPYQAYIFTKAYPLRRDVYVIKLGTRSGLGAGFAAHLAGEKGQLIIHKLGMVAAQSPVRMVEIKTE